MGEFNVFDEWGNFVGRFTPAGMGVEGCLFTLVLFTVGIFLFAVYIVFKMAAEGILALTRGDIASAVKKLTVPVLVIGAVVLMGAISAASQAQREAHDRQVAFEAQWALANPDKAFTIIRVANGRFTVKNNLRQTVSGLSYDCSTVPVDGPHGAEIAPFGSGQEIFLYCYEYSRGGITFYGEGQWLKVGNFCLGLHDNKCQ